MKLKDIHHNVCPYFMKVIPTLTVYTPLCVCVSKVTPTYLDIIREQCLQEVGVVIQPFRGAV